MIIDTSTITTKVIKDLFEWETQLLKQRRYIDEKINEIERIIKENYGEIQYIDTDSIHISNEREVK